MHTPREIILTLQSGMNFFEITVPIRTHSKMFKRAQALQLFAQYQ